MRPEAIFIAAVLAAALSLASAHAASLDYCGSKGYTFVPVPQDDDTNFLNGDYMRVHPSGKYVVYTSNGRARIVALENRDGHIKARIIKTPMAAEAAPIQPSWILISSYNYPLGNNSTGMAYWKFDDLLRLGEATPVLFVDKDHSNYYQSSSQLPGSTKTQLKFRTELYGKSTRDYTVTFGPSGSDVEMEPEYNICTNVDNLSKPVLSRDGTELTCAADETTTTSSAAPAASPQYEYDGQYESAPQVTKILHINEDHTCRVVDNLHYSTSKATSFEYAGKGKKGQITFTAEGLFARKKKFSFSHVAYIYDRDTGLTSRISRPWIENASYPGFIHDGRVIYKAFRIDPKTNQKTGGLVIVNPKEIIYPPAQKWADAAKSINQAIPASDPLEACR